MNNKICHSLDFQNYTLEDMQSIQIGAIVKYFSLEELLENDIHAARITKIDANTALFENLYYEDRKNKKLRNPFQFQQKLNEMLNQSILIQIKEINGKKIYAPISKIHMIENGRKIIYDSNSFDISLIEVCYIKGGIISQEFKTIFP